jgi:nicotinate phosphoribosyltransferase
MSFDDEQEAFDHYADAMPDNSTLLVDTYDTLHGGDRAIKTARKLQSLGYNLSGIRLDSGDLAWLSQQARSKLDAAGFPDVNIVASNDLDEYLIESLRHQGAKIDIWGVGTNLVTAADQPALGGVYKLGALRQSDGSWLPRIKFSEQRAKSSIPGRLQVRRFIKDGFFIGDAIYDIDAPLPEHFVIVDPNDPSHRKPIPIGATFTDLLQPVMQNGELTGAVPDLSAARDRRQRALRSIDPGILRLDNPHIYPAGIEQSLHERREHMITQHRQIP